MGRWVCIGVEMRASFVWLLLGATAACVLSARAEVSMLDPEEVEVGGFTGGLGSQKTSADLKAFDTAYDRSLVDASFDPTKLFNDMEKEGEKKARQNQGKWLKGYSKRISSQAQLGESSDTQKGGMNAAAGALEQAANIAEQMAKHPNTIPKKPTKMSKKPKKVTKKSSGPHMVQVKPSPKSTPPKGKTDDQGKGHTKAKADTKKHQKKHKKVGHGHKSKKKAPKKAPKGGKKKAPKGGKSKKGAKGGKVDVGGYAKAALALAKKGAPASALLAVAKKAFKSGNVAKAKAFLAVAEAAADTQKEEPKVQKPLENLLDVLHRKQGKALTLNPAALAAQQAKAKMTHAAKPAAKAAAPPMKKAAAPKPVTAPAAKKPATVKKAITKKTTVTKSIPAHKAVTITKPKKAGKGHVEKLASKLSHGKLPTGNPKKPHVEHKKAEDNLP